MMTISEMTKLPCGCYKRRRRARLLNWLLGQKWWWLWDICHGPVTLTAEV